jgi:hypothetical protein
VTTQAQKEEHKKRQIVTGYHNALATGNLAAIASLWAKYPQYHEEFDHYKELAPVNGRIE